jgi:hypothetical protein
MLSRKELKQNTAYISFEDKEREELVLLKDTHDDPFSY